MSSISLTLSPQSNVLDGIVLYEPIDAVILDKLIYSDLLRVEFNNKNAAILYDNEKQQLTKYKSMMIDGRVPVKYTRPKNNPFGRSNPLSALGLYPIRREIRHTLACKRFYDYDIKNAHPCVILYLYVTKRQEYFDLVVNDYGCTEEQAKNLFIILLYGGSLDCWVWKNKIDISKVQSKYKGVSSLIENADITAFRIEMESINAVILANNPEIAKVTENVKQEQGKTNFKLAGTVCSYFLQEYEIRILEQLFLYCMEKGLIANDQAVLAADGIMLEKSLVSDPDSLLIEFNQLIISKLGFDLVFTRKDMTLSYGDILQNHVTHEYNFDISTFHNIVPYNLPFDNTERIKLEDQREKFIATGASDNKFLKQNKKDIDALIESQDHAETIAKFYMRKEYFEEFHFKVMSPLSYGRKIEKGHEIISTETLAKMYRNLDGNFAGNWQDSRFIKTFQKVDFAPFPIKINSNTFNLFGGLDGEKLAFGYNLTIDQTKQLGKNSNIFIKHLWYLCGKENRCLEYCLNYLAHLVQLPGEIPRVALVFKSKQGVGKNIFFENLIEKLAGEEYLLSTSQLDNIIGRFPMNSQKLLVILDEASGKDTFMSNDQIKSFITAPHLTYERKGIDGIKIRNCSRMLFFYNEGCGVKIEQTDRRFVAMECADEMRNNTIYFKSLIKAFNTPSMVRDFYLFLKNRDITQYDTVNDRPLTQLYKEIQTSTLPCEHKYFVDKYDTVWKDCGQITLPKTANEFYIDYKMWCYEKTFKPMTELSFLKRINDKKYFFITKTKKNTIHYTINLKNLGLFIDTNTVTYEEPICDKFPTCFL